MKRILCIFASALFLATTPRAADFGDLDQTFNPPLGQPQQWCDWTLNSIGNATMFVGVWGGEKHGVARVLKDGAQDFSWGNQGRADLPGIPELGGVGMSARGLLPTPDGGVIAVDARLVKLSRAGQRDPQFGTDGVSDPIGLHGYIESFALQADGAIVILSRGFNGGPVAQFTRIAANGRLDPSFGNGGVIQVNTNGVGIYAWSVQGGRELEYGTYTLDAATAPVLRLRRISGSGDNIVSNGEGRIAPKHGLAQWMSPGMQVLPDGDVVFSDGEKVVRYNTIDTLDGSFAQGGVATLPPLDPPLTFTPWPTSRLLSVGQGGSLTVVVHLEYSSGGFFPAVSYARDHAFRLGANGQVDSTFPQGKTIGMGQFTKYLQIDDGRLISLQGSGTSCPTRLTSDALRMNVAIAEYYNPVVDRYFITAEGLESGVLDSDQSATRWVRTGWRFGGWLAAALDGTKRVCRFYGDDGKGGSGGHFYTLEGFECDHLRSLDAATPAGQPAWRFEGYAFSAAEPTNGICARNLTPIYRAYNQGFGQGRPANHRYTADLATYQSMVAQGWAAEGVRFCMPPISDPVSKY